jgi:gliding motility-associated-like protein
LVIAVNNHTSENGTSAIFSMVLNTQPSADVTVPLASSDITEGKIDVASITFTNSNWDTPQSILVTGVDDKLIDGNITFNILTGNSTSTDNNYNGLNVNDVTVVNDDDDVAGFLLDKYTAITNESGVSDNFNVVLTAQPNSDVTIDLLSDDLTEGTLNVAQLIFKPEQWNVPQNVVINGENDNLVDGNIVFHIIASVNTAKSDANFISLPAQIVDVTNFDNDASLPSAQSDIVSVDEDSSIICNVLNNDSGLEDGGLILTIINQPTNGLTIVNADNTVTYTPNVNYHGSDSFSYRVCDRFGDCSSALVSITVNSVFDAPVAEPDYYSVKINSGTTSMNVSDNDSDVDNDLVPGSVIVLKISSIGGSAIPDNMGNLDYTPALNFYGNDTIVYQIFDAVSLSDIDTLFVTVDNEISVANTFSPNGDGINDVLIIPNIEDYDNELFIFNRWGNEVFHALNYRNDANAWDGRAQSKTNLGGNEILPVGTYFYILKLKGSRKPIKGYIYLKY